MVNCVNDDCLALMLIFKYVEFFCFQLCLLCKPVVPKQRPKAFLGK